VVGEWAAHWVDESAERKELISARRKAATWVGGEVVAWGDSQAVRKVFQKVCGRAAAKAALSGRTRAARWVC
jgi:hypothetical protein